MKTKQREVQIIENENTERPYGLDGTDAIVEHPMHGLLWIRNDYGGVDTLEGGAVRWKHGTAVKLQPGDTFDSLGNQMWTATVSLGEAVLAGQDETRPVMDWPGSKVESVAAAAGLA